ncbi:MAG TPA: beta-ketoacyl-[acyl-carrier-protein] synthase II [Candidatus Omnitrophica bacterium]|nr:MAG: beta-ketoacyl-[acyl-carrier-protein] synthase II [Candidatus Omnitrophota bacterium]RKY34184.1 MAG: beta-ketoacyl-[acyl-carrier-protein] synthase II [Candidatus Omnitrophota bacterium]RKY43846.1 MAG: beta-ketoacyl-[acyl-carrier-protein] synthase II [Candidatus Omnitrophota bacterium]HEC70085.1 beta-ketoacyl-[acyl-carrier-protein] synthase II [Candidatus Omnitrophota bacterium]
MERRVVVTGCGVISPLGLNKEENLSALIEGKSGIDRITQFDASSFSSQIAGEVKGFDPTKIFPPKEVKRISRFVQFAVSASSEAISQSGLDFSRLDPYRVGVVIGSGIGSLKIVEEQHKVLLKKGPSRLSPFLIPLLITNEAAGQVAIYFKLKGLNFCTVTACASGAQAIGEAFRSIKDNKAEVVIAGGTEACITSLGVGGFCALKALSTRNSEPQRASRPFDKNRDGFVIAEGAGILVLEELEHAKKRKAEILAEVCGYGATCDAYHITAPEPSGEAAAKAMNLALEEAKADASGVDYINAHGTSTLLNDKTETKAIKIALGAQAKKVWVSSTKSMTGHMLGAAGAGEAVFCCLAIVNNLVFPTINLEEPDPDCDLDYTPNKVREKELNLVLSNSLGFGGHNVTLAFRKFKG